MQARFRRAGLDAFAWRAWVRQYWVAQIHRRVATHPSVTITNEIGKCQHYARPTKENNCQAFHDYGPPKPGISTSRSPSPPNPLGQFSVQQTMRLSRAAPRAYSKSVNVKFAGRSHGEHGRIQTPAHTILHWMQVFPQAARLDNLPVQFAKASVSSSQIPI